MAMLAMAGRNRWWPIELIVLSSRSGGGSVACESAPPSHLQPESDHQSDGNSLTLTESYRPTITDDRSWYIQQHRVCSRSPDVYGCEAFMLRSYLSTTSLTMSLHSNIAPTPASQASNVSAAF